MWWTGSAACGSLRAGRPNAGCRPEAGGACGLQPTVYSLMGGREAVDDVDGGGEADARTRLASGPAQGDGQVRFPQAHPADQDGVGRLGIGGKVSRIAQPVNQTADRSLPRKPSFFFSHARSAPVAALPTFLAPRCRLSARDHMRPGAPKRAKGTSRWSGLRTWVLRLFQRLQGLLHRLVDCLFPLLYYCVNRFRSPLCCLAKLTGSLVDQ